LDSRDVVLITGALDPLASQLLEYALEREPEVRFLLLSGPATPGSTAHDFPAAGHPALELLDGETTAIDFGLSGPEYRELAARVTHLVHLVPALDPELAPTELERRNVGSMREVLEFATASARLRALVVQSSTAVSGDYSGLVLEQDLALGQRFRSPVEETLAIAERMARAQWERLPIAIARCARIVGDSRTGRPYPPEPLWSLLEHVATAPAGYEVPLPLDAPGLLHLVPSDVVVRALFRLLLDRRAAQRCVHVTDPESPTLRRFFALLAEKGGRRSSAELSSKRLARALGAGSGPRGRRLKRLAEELPHAVAYDRENARELLPDLTFPPFESYVERLLEAARGAAESSDG
jgi:nucleoside-diphosphate-sugar epimerase